MAFHVPKRPVTPNRIGRSLSEMLGLWVIMIKGDICDFMCVCGRGCLLAWPRLATVPHGKLDVMFWGGCGCRDYQGQKTSLMLSRTYSIRINDLHTHVASYFVTDSKLNHQGHWRSAYLVDLKQYLQKGRVEKHNYPGNFIWVDGWWKF